MIKRGAKCLALLLTVVSAEQAIQHVEIDEEKSSAPLVSKGSGMDWFVFTLGFLLGATIETGTNFGAQDSKTIQCLGQTSDLIEAIYFTYFYIYSYIDTRGFEYISYLSVYISRGVNTVAAGPCWNIGWGQ